ncbi:hypothetical protein M0811_05231 [Anaeramoeba ignava]|uniref:Uncharacterized protein n=1 Tax=Anaeramoeba ignava TaxID=1746090 RepID=A0A9Q0LSZ2_ANAIG|nr:hypothetical protein M0811_05231 [Anaeramoeba ignava]
MNSTKNKRQKQKKKRILQKKKNKIKNKIKNQNQNQIKNQNQNQNQNQNKNKNQNQNKIILSKEKIKKYLKPKSKCFKIEFNPQDFYDFNQDSYSNELQKSNLFNSNISSKKIFVKKQRRSILIQILNLLENDDTIYPLIPVPESFDHEVYFGQIPQSKNNFYAEITLKISILSTLIKGKHSSNFSVFAERAELFFQIEQYHDCICDCLRSLKLYPSIKVFQLCGQSWINLGEYLIGLPYFLTALTLDPFDKILSQKAKENLKILENKSIQKLKQNPKNEKLKDQLQRIKLSRENFEKFFKSNENEN